MKTAGLDVGGVSLRLGSFALRDVSFTAAPGEIVVLFGANGAGKSVCLETIAGFHSPDGGHILLSGRDLTELPPEMRRISFLIQDFALFPHLTVAQNVALGSDARRDERKLQALLTRFGIAHIADARPEVLSPGERQRTALARALASRPYLYLFDEPFSALDAATRDALGEELATFLRRTDTPSVFVTHDRAEALALGDRIVVIDGGTIVQQGLAAEVFARPRSIAVAHLLGIENLIDGRIETEGGGVVRVAVGDRTIEAWKGDAKIGPTGAVTLAIRAETIHLHQALDELRPNVFRARVVELRRAGPVSRASLDCGFRLVAYALPQTADAARLTAGGEVDVEIQASAVHVLDRTSS